MVQINDGGMQKGHEKAEPDSFSSNTLGGKIGNTLLGVFKRAVNSITDWFEDRLINFAVGVLIKVEKSGATVLGALIKELKDKKAIPAFLKPIFDEIENPKNEIGAMLVNTASQGAIGGLFGAIFDPLMATVRYTLMEAIHPIVPPYSEALAGYRRGSITKETATEIIDDYGIRHEFREMLFELSRSLMGFGDIRDSYLRGETTEAVAKEYIKKQGYEDIDVDKIFKLFIKVPSIAESVLAYFRGTVAESELREVATKNGIDQKFLDIIVSANRKLVELMDVRSIYFRADKSDTWLKSTLAKLGYDDDTINDIKTIFPYFPNVPDLIRFAVREVYSPEIVTKYGQMEDLPSKFVEEAGKAGLPEDQAKNFWAAHWELPGFREGAEMLHRGVITYDDLVTLLRTLDVMPYWRDKLIKIAYSPYTRVDTRRMYAKGILDREAVKKAYKDIGYDEEHAENLTLWTEASSTPKKEEDAEAEKDLTKADILEGYQRKFFTLQETIGYLIFLGYDQEEAEYYTSKIEYKENKENKDQIIKLYEDMYKKGVADDNTVTIELAKFGVTTAEINYYLTKWAIANVGKSAVPSITDVKNWLKAKVLSREEFIEELSSMGYAAKYIDCYLREAKLQGL